jgi:hypothetical protein
MTTDTLNFFRALYAGMGEGYLTLTAIHPDKQRPTPSRHIPVVNEVALREALECLFAANRAGWGAYLSVATRKADLGRWRRGGKDDLAYLPALFVDIDTDPEDALCALRLFTPAPSCIVSSGAGIHSYWLTEPMTDFALADRILRGLASYFHADRTNVAQSLRIPGTINTKPQRGGALCHVIDMFPDRRYTLAGFAAFAAPCPTRSIRSSSQPASISTDTRRAISNEIAACLLHQYGGFLKSNGWIAALCPCGHHRDSPGAHFGFNPQTGIGFCFGRHKGLSLQSMCELLNVV